MKDFDTDEEKVANDIKSDPSAKEPTVIKFKNEIYRPTGVTILGILYVVFGIIFVAFAILFSTAVLFLLFSGVMGSLGAIGGGMPLPLGIDGIDSTMMLEPLDMISGLPGMGSLPGTEIMPGLANNFALGAASGMMMDFEVIMVIMMGVFTIAAILIIEGVILFVVGRGLLRGKKWARILAIVGGIISISFTASSAGDLGLIALGLFAIDGIILYYLFRPRVREFFIQTSIKNSIKNSKIET